MATAYNKLTELEKQFYGSVSFGGSSAGANGEISPSDTLGSNKWIGLRVNTAGVIKVRKLDGSTIWTLNVVAGEQLSIAIDTLYLTGSTPGIEVHGYVGLTEDIEDVYT